MLTACLAALVLAQPGPGSTIDAQIAELQARVATLEAAPTSSSASLPPGWVRADDYITKDTDLADAVEAIQRSPECGPISGDGQDRTGCRILIGRGIYETKTINLCRQVTLEGVSGRGPGAATRLVTQGQTAIHVRPHAWCVANGYQVGALASWVDGSWSEIRALSLLDAAPPAAPPYSAGVHVEAHAHLEALSVRRFVQGVRISADVNRAETGTTTGFPYGPVTNANLTTVERVSVQGTQHAGVFFDGGDSNAGYSLGLSVDTACQSQAHIDAIGPCAAVLESSFLGNTHVAPHVAHTGNGRNHYLSDDTNARNVWVGAYGESGNLGFVSANDVVVGGLAWWDPEGPGLRIREASLTGFCAIDDRPDRNPLGQRACFGRRAGAAMSVEASAPPFVPSVDVLRLRALDKNGVGTFRWDVANAHQAIDISARTSTSPITRAGEVRFPRTCN